MIEGIGGLYGYWWAGDSSEHVTLKDGARGKVITQLNDSSGNGRHLTNSTGNYEPGYRAGLTLNRRQGGPWSTNAACVSIDKYSNGSQIYGNLYYLPSSVGLTGPFALLDVLTNSRIDGERDYWGAPGMRCVQGRAGKISINIAGVNKVIAPSWPIGPVILAVIRDASDKISVYANGVDITTPGLAAMPGTFTVSQIGWDGVHRNSHYDDYRFAMAMVNGVLSKDTLLEVLAFWSTKYNIRVHLS